MIPATLADLAVPIESLRPYSRNPRRGNLDAIKASLQTNGQYRPVVARKGTGEVLAGNHTLAAAVELGWESIAATFVDVDDEQAARIVLADNRTSDLGGYDDQELADLLGSLPELDGTGYGSDDLQLLLASLEQEAEPDPEVAPPELPENPVTKPGDLYELGPHRLLCGDCRDPADVGRLLAGDPVQVAITSPPYADRRKYDARSGFEPIRPDDYVDWFEPAVANIAAHLAGDGSWFLNIKPGVTPDGLDTELYVFDLVLAHVRRWGWHFATEFCWERVGVPKQVTRRFRNQFEPVYQFTRGDWKMRADAVRHYSAGVPVGPANGQADWGAIQGQGVEFFGPKRRVAGIGNASARQGRVGALQHLDGSGPKKRRRGTTQLISDFQGVPGSAEAGAYVGPGLAYPGNRLPTFTGSHQAVGHPAAFPVGLPAFFIRAYTDPGELVYDPFVGSGSTLLAAEETERVGYGIDISPGYCDITVERWQQHTGQKAKRRRRAKVQAA